MTAKTKKAMMVGVVNKSGDGNPLLQAAEQFLTDHYSTAEAATAQWHTEGAGPWIKSYAARLTISYSGLSLVNQSEGHNTHSECRSLGSTDSTGATRNGQE